MQRKKLGPNQDQGPLPGGDAAPGGGIDPEVRELVGQAAGFFAVPITSLRLDTVTGFDLYLESPRDNKHVLYRNSDLKFTEEHRSKLQQSSVSKIFICSTDRDKYMRYLERHLGPILADDSIPSRERAEILYRSASQIVQELFKKPGTGENIQRAQNLVECTVALLMKSGEHLGSLLSIMSFDYQTYTHSVNVCVFGIALGRRIGLSAMELNDLGTGLVLHDVGKSGIDAGILLKDGPLTDEEWAIVRTHPELGVKMLKDSGRVSPHALGVVHQHHEKCSGRGYPQGLKEADIHLYAKVAALADVFDALTTRRTYKQAVESFPAIRIMQQEMPDSFNAELLRELILMMNAAEIFGDRPARQEKRPEAA